MKLSYYKSKVTDFYRVILKDPCRKNILIMSGEFLWFLLTNRSIARNYFLKYFYRKGFNNYSHYILPLKAQFRSWDMNDEIYCSIFWNKYLFEKFFSQFNLKLAKNLAHNVNSLFFVNGRVTQINTPDHFLDFIRTMTVEGSSTGTLFIKKTEDSFGGKNIFKILVEDLKSDNIDFNSLFVEIIKSGYLFQEAVIQHDLIKEINPFCVNTIRFDTYTNRNNEAKLISAFMRIGVNNTYVDNISCGGLFVGVNIEDGTLFPEAFTDITHGKGKHFTVHPATGFRFEGFQIPFFQEAKAMVLKAAGLVPRVKIIGWDVAIQSDGPIIIEGNVKPGLVLSEIAQKGFYNNPVALDLIDELQGQK